MLDIFPSVDTVTSLNNAVQEAVGARENSEAEAEDAIDDVESEEHEEDIGENIDVSM